jgi:phospholipase C
MAAGMAAGSLAVGSLAAACAKGGQGSTTTTTTAPPTTIRPEQTPIDTIVVVMLENRSFDHHFGFLPGVDGLMGKDLSNTDPKTGEVVRPYHMDDACTTKDLDHSFEGTHLEWNGGRNDGFVARSGMEAMGYRLPADLPFTSALAREFTVCDRWFCSVLGPTFPNRFYLHSATSDGRVKNDIIPFTKPSIWDRLDEAGIPWGYYYSDLPFLALYPDVSKRGTDKGQVAKLDRYFADASSGRLPRVAFVEPSFTGPMEDDDHPPSNSQLAQRFAAQVFGALASSPQWPRSLFILTFDEHGGFYDHVPPPMVDDEFAAQGFDHAGFRVPAVLAGPYVPRRRVSSVVLDHPSILRFIEWRFGLKPLGMRDAKAGLLLPLLDLTKGDPSVPQLPVPALDPARARLCSASPASGGDEGNLGPPTSRSASSGVAGSEAALALAEITPRDIRGEGDSLPKEPTHPSLVEV